MADTTVKPLPHGSDDVLAWLLHEAVDHPEVTLGAAMAAREQVHTLQKLAGV